MTASAEVATPPHRHTLGPFAVLGLVAIATAGGAVFEISYWVGVSATSPSVVGTALGILATLVGFLAWGLRAPPND